MTALAHTPQDVLRSLTTSDWAHLAQLVHRLNAHPFEFVDWVSPEEFRDDEWPEEVPMFSTVAQDTIEFIYRCLMFRDVRRLELVEYSVELIKTPPRDLSVFDAITRISGIADADHRYGDSFAHAFDNGVIVDLLARLLEFRQAKAA